MMRNGVCHIETKKEKESKVQSKEESRTKINVAKEKRNDPFVLFLYLLHIASSLGLPTCCCIDWLQGFVNRVRSTGKSRCSSYSSMKWIFVESGKLAFPNGC